MEDPIVPERKVSWMLIRQVCYILGTLALFIFALDMMVMSLRDTTGSVAQAIILATSNPFTGLFIGLLVTAIIQSSSTTTSIAVALVASGAITPENATPIVMGANIGTTITSTIVSLTFINKKKEFRRSVTIGTYHDFFNLLTACILFPLQYFFNFLSNTSLILSKHLFDSAKAGNATPTRHFHLFGDIVSYIEGFISNHIILIVISFILLLTSIILFRKIISGMILKKNPDKFSKFFFKSRLLSFVWGVVTTAAIRSSTITTSLVVPLAAKRIIKLNRGFAFILGANIGTTITAFIAAILNAGTGDVISLAITHFMFNFIGFLIFYPLPLLQKIPATLAKNLGQLAFRKRFVVILYIMLLFFIIPFLLIYLNQVIK